MHHRGEQDALQRGAGQAELVQPTGTAQVLLPTAAQAQGSPAALATARQTHQTHSLPSATVRETRGKPEEKAQKNSSEAARSLPRAKPPPSAFGAPSPWEGFLWFPWQERTRQRVSEGSCSPALHSAQLPVGQDEDATHSACGSQTP